MIFSSWFLTVFRMPLTTCRYMAQEVSVSECRRGAWPWTMSRPHDANTIKCTVLQPMFWITQRDPNTFNTNACNNLQLELMLSHCQNNNYIINENKQQTFVNLTDLMTWLALTAVAPTTVFSESISLTIPPKHGAVRRKSNSLYFGYICSIVGLGNTVAYRGYN